jgi:parallel beta-helix repeat protein
MKQLYVAAMTITMCGLANAATINVPADYASIQDAIDASVGGDEILVAPGTYTGTGDRVIYLPNKPITVRATGTPEETILDGEGARGVVAFAAALHDTIIEGFTITGGSADYGGGIASVGSWPKIQGCTITNNTATHNGGGIDCYNGRPTITGCTISGNTAGGFGGGIDCSTTGGDRTTITGCTISGNTATDGGGIYSNNQGPVLTDTTVCSNSPNQITGTYSDEGGNTVAAICPVPGACCTNGACVIAEQDDCLAFYGQWLGEGTTCNDSPCPIACLGDVTGDGQVSVNDVLTVIGNWGPCP